MYDNTDIYIYLILIDFNYHITNYFLKCCLHGKHVGMLHYFPIRIEIYVCFSS